MEIMRRILWKSFDEVNSSFSVKQKVENRHGKLA
jgi:hypothetical protein